MNHLMIDIETLSTQPNAVICAIGAVSSNHQPVKPARRSIRPLIRVPLRIAAPISALTR